MNTEQCKCGFPEKWAKDPDFPMSLDIDLNEFGIDDRAGTKWIIHYCPSCGGKLPDSKRGEIYPIDLKEKAEVDALLLNITRLTDMNRILGNADLIGGYPGPCKNQEEKDKIYGRSVPYVRAHMYHKRWRTIALSFLEMPDGSVTGAYGGKPKQK